MEGCRCAPAFNFLRAPRQLATLQNVEIRKNGKIWRSSRPKCNGINRSRQNSACERRSLWLYFSISTLALISKGGWV